MGDPTVDFLIDSIDAIDRDGCISLHYLKYLCTRTVWIESIEPYSVAARTLAELKPALESLASNLSTLSEGVAVYLSSVISGLLSIPGTLVWTSTWNQPDVVTSRVMDRLNTSGRINLCASCVRCLRGLILETMECVPALFLTVHQLESYSGASAIIKDYYHSCVTSACITDQSDRAGRRRSSVKSCSECRLLPTR